MTTDTLIIGGGLSGLYAAYLLHQRKERFLLLEARKQTSGRIRSAYRDTHVFDLGPSWYWPETNPRFAGLVEKFKLPHYSQHTEGDAIVEDADGSVQRRPHHDVDPRHAFRLEGGTKRIAESLSAVILPRSFRPRSRVTAIKNHSDHLAVTAESAEDRDHFTAARIILAVPPRLAAASIKFGPELPAEVRDALKRTPTWMAGDAKFFALYDEPFWRADGLSGSVYSEAGLFSDVHDASLPDGPAALTGFLRPNRDERVRLGDDLIPSCLAELARFFGPSAAAPRETILHDWSTEPLAATAEDVPLFEHPEYGLPESCLSLFNGRLCFAGTEASTEHGGYMEGALAAAERAVESCVPASS